MGASSCCSSVPEVDEDSKASVRQGETNSKIDPSQSNTIKITKQKTNGNNKPNLELSESQVDEVMGELQLFLSFLQTRSVRKQTIGQGGQGKIRKYYSDKYKREVVEKKVNLNNCTRGTLGVSGIQSLIKEALLLAGFDHPNIVKIFDFKINPPTITMEYCAKGSLRQILDKKINLPVKERRCSNEHWCC